MQARLPLRLYATFCEHAEQQDVTQSDLGAFYLLKGWNADRVAAGLSPIPVPDYLGYLERHVAGRSEVQDPLEVELLAS